MQTQTHQVLLGAVEVEKRYVRWSDGEADREWRCLTLLAQLAPGTAARPVRRGLHDGAPVVVMERLPGEPLGGAPLTARQTTALGGALRRVWAVPREAVVAAGIGERRFGPTGHRETVMRWLEGPYDEGQCREPGLVADAVAAATCWLARHDVLPPPRLEVLGIADLNPANVLWDGETCRLVDFEDAGLTDPAYETADHLEHLAGRLHGVLDPDALVEAVALSPEERDRTRAFRPLWAAFWLAMLLPGNPGFRRNPLGTTEAQASHLLCLLG